MHLSGFLSKDVCNSAIKELQDTSWEEHKFYNAYRDASKTHPSLDFGDSTPLDYCIGDIPQKKSISDLLWNAIKKYVDTYGGYWNSWEGYTEIRCNRYTKEGSMDPHVDHIQSIFPGTPKGIPILSIVGVLNDDYEGGNFMVFKDTEIKLKAGDLLLFPSNFIYPHWVNPVTKGTRYSYVSWVY